MNRTLQLALGLLSALACAQSSAGGCVTNRYGDTLCAPANSRCVVDPYGDWYCSKPGGDALLDRYRKPVCGAGRCVVDVRGDVKCSNTAQGGAARDRYGEAVCTEACVPASPAMCHALRR